MIYPYIFLNKSMLRKMRIILSSLLLVLALHFLLQGINYRKIINFCQVTKDTLKLKKSSKSENFTVSDKPNENITDVKRELLKSIQCNEPPIVASNKYIDDKNDSNFQSNVLNINKFYNKNINDSSDDHMGDKPGGTNINPLSDINQYSNQPDTWKYKNELVMNGGQLLNGVTGYDNLTDQYSTIGESSLLEGCSSNLGSCEPPTRGAMVNDDLRMGLGKINNEYRLTN